MMHNCPFCGHYLAYPLRDGLAGCPHCNRSFDSSISNVLASAAWYARDTRCVSAERLMSELKIPEPIAVVVMALVVEQGYSQDEFVSALKTLGIRK